MAPLSLVLGGCGAASLAGASSSEAPRPSTRAAQPSPGNMSVVSAPQAGWIGRSDWIRASAEVVAPQAESPEAALQRAKALARRAAIELQAGISVRSAFLDYASMSGAHQETLIQSLMSTEVDGIVLEERVLEAPMKPLSEAGGYRRSVVLEVRVLARTPSDGHDLQVELALNRQTFRDGEAAEVRLRVSQDAAVQLINLTEVGATVLVPNAFLKTASLKRGERFVFPGPELERQGVRLSVRALPHRSVTRESLLVVAVRKGFEAAEIGFDGKEVFVRREGDKTTGLLAEILGPLLELPKGSWAFDHVAYRVLPDGP